MNLQNMIIALELTGYSQEDSIPGATCYDGVWQVTDAETFMNWFRSNTLEEFEGRPIDEI